MQKPQIKSFSMVVQAHSPLRGAAASTSSSKNGSSSKKASSGGSGGGNDPFAQKSGSTIILNIVPEGTRVKKGEVVCKLDSAAFKDELQAQLIRWEQAKAWVDQARSILEVSEISLKEYRDGILPQDKEQLKLYITICETQVKQSRDDLAFSQKLADQSLQSPSQLRASKDSLASLEIALQEAHGMREQLYNFTAPKLLKNLEAKISAVQSDLFAQESAFKLEDVRRKKLEHMIELCTLRASRDGMVAYATEVSGGGPRASASLIQEGAAVRQGQSLILLPDFENMMVKVRINESKISLIHIGQRCDIRVEANPDQVIHGQVTEVTPLPAPTAGQILDVKLYYANVKLDPGFRDLRTGLSARVTFHVDRRTDVTRVPLSSLRWKEGAAFVALPRSAPQNFAWQAVTLGLIDSAFAEVISGLKPGDQIYSDCESLPEPPRPAISTEKRVANLATPGPVR